MDVFVESMPMAASVWALRAPLGDASSDEDSAPSAMSGAPSLRRRVIQAPAQSPDQTAIEDTVPLSSGHGTGLSTDAGVISTDASHSEELDHELAQDPALEPVDDLAPREPMVDDDASARPGTPPCEPDVFMEAAEEDDKIDQDDEVELEASVPEQMTEEGPVVPAAGRPTTAAFRSRRGAGGQREVRRIVTAEAGTSAGEPFPRPNFETHPCPCTRPHPVHVPSPLPLHSLTLSLALAAWQVRRRPRPATMSQLLTKPKGRPKGCPLGNRR